MLFEGNSRVRVWDEGLLEVYIEMVVVIYNVRCRRMKGDRELKEEERIGGTLRQRQLYGVLSLHSRALQEITTDDRQYTCALRASPRMLSINVLNQNLRHVKQINAPTMS